MEQNHDVVTASPSANETATPDNVDDATEEQEEGKEEEVEEGGEENEGTTVTTEVEAMVKGLDLQRTVGLLGAISFTVGSMIGRSVWCCWPIWWHVHGMQIQ